MILYVDETENKELFVVAGLLLPSKNVANSVFNGFKNKIKLFKLSTKTRQRLFMEFKSVDLDNHFQKMKVKMLEEISSVDSAIIFSCYLKKNRDFNQKLKEDTYVMLLSKIANELYDDTDIIFDSFNKSDFERRIVNSISQILNVKSITLVIQEKKPG